jgi:hypothetical protein
MLMGAMSIASFAQVSVGVKGIKETGDFGNYGIGVQVGYQIGNFNIVPGFNQYFNRTKTTIQSYQQSPTETVENPVNYAYKQQGINLDAQYLVKIANFTVYPIVGVNYTNFNSTALDLDGGWRFGLSTGGGIRLSIIKNLDGVLETTHRFLIKKDNAYGSDAAIVSAGLVYKL